MSPVLTLLAVDDDPLSLDLVRDALDSMGVRILTAANGAAARQVLAAERPQIVLLDLMLPDVSGLELLEEITQSAPGTDVLLLTGHYTPESAVEAIRKGASDYLTKPVKIGVLRARVKELVDEAGKRWEAARLESELLQANRFQGMVGRSPQMLELFALIRRVAPHFRVGLVRGATGTGKELAAHAMHALSPVAAGPFIIANCSAITESLFESEMFGHLKGSFTGATGDKKGLFEAAHGGTLFLDELGDLPFAMQSKLLRAIQQQEIRPVGASATRKISVRVVAATNRPLEEMMGAGTFREDLYYRLSMVEIRIPNLSERMEDFPFLVRHFVAHFAAEYGKNLAGVTARAQALLARHSWPGNVRELENVIGSACMMADGEQVDVRDLPPSFHKAAASLAPASAGPGDRAGDRASGRAGSHAGDRAGDRLGEGPGNRAGVGAGGDWAGGRAGSHAGDGAGEWAGDRASGRAGEGAGDGTGEHRGNRAGDRLGVGPGNRAGVGAGGDWAGGRAGSHAGDETGDRTGEHRGNRAGDWLGERAGGHAGDRAGDDADDRASGHAGRHAGGGAGDRLGEGPGNRAGDGAGYRAGGHAGGDRGNRLGDRAGGHRGSRFGEGGEEGPGGEANGIELISLDELSQRHARAVVAHFAGNKSKAAEVLGVTRSTLYRLLGEG